MAIKMRINHDKKSVCTECDSSYMDTLEMYDLRIFGLEGCICKECAETLFHKLLKADCLYMGKVKTKEDQARINAVNAKKGMV